MLVSLAFSLLSCLAAAGTVAVFLWKFTRDIADIDEVALRSYRPQQITRVYARDGELIGELFRERRTFVRHSEIPKHVESAFLAAEDADFYNHRGMDYMGMVRAMVANLKAGKIRQGASTITQQVVKNFILSPERTFERKVQELVLARRLELVLGKEQILELYLNEIFFGHGRYGVEEASRYYFGKGVADINIGQAAMLATLPKAPSAASPFKNPKRAKARQIYVLEQMRKHGFASPEELQRYIDAPLELERTPATKEIVAGGEEFIDLVRKRLVSHYGEEGLHHLGAPVTTTLDMKVQAAARAAVVDGLRALDLRGELGRATKAASARSAKRVLAKLRKQPPRAGKPFMSVVAARPDAATGTVLPEAGFVADIGDKKAFVFIEPGGRYDDPELSWAQQFVPGGLVQVVLDAKAGLKVADSLPEGFVRARLPTGAEACVVLADSATGELRAMIGGSNYRRAGFNRVLQAKRQPGSSFKPFVYGSAVASKKFTPASLVSDSPDVYDKWRPTNFERDVYRGDIRVRTAITHSVNTVAIKLLDAVGPRTAIEFARKAGIESELAPDLSLALGTSEVTPYELMRAYLTLARLGNRVEPKVILRVEAPGIDTWEPQLAGEQVLDSGVAFLTTSLMQSVVKSGTGRGAQALNRPAAGKTGTSASHRDAWFAGFTPDLVAVAWVGHDQPRSLGRRETGGRAALPIWLAAMESASESLGPSSFTPPASVSVRSIDAATGLLARPEAVAQGGEAVLDEYFLAGTEPQEFADASKRNADDVLLDLYDDEEMLPEGAETAEQEGSADRQPSAARVGSGDDETLPNLR